MRKISIYLLTLCEEGRIVGVDAESIGQLKDENMSYQIRYNHTSHDKAADSTGERAYAII